MNATTIDSIVSRIAEGRADSGGVDPPFVEGVPLLRGSKGFAGSGDGPLDFVVEAMKRLATPFSLGEFFVAVTEIFDRKSRQPQHYRIYRI
jgi:hypothetical protein